MSVRRAHLLFLSRLGDAALISTFAIGTWYFLKCIGNKIMTRLVAAAATARFIYPQRGLAAAGVC